MNRWWRQALVGCCIAVMLASCGEQAASPGSSATEAVADPTPAATPTSALTEAATEAPDPDGPVSYTHLTLPTKRIV